MRVLVTGGSGFIGSHVVDKLRARGHEPVIYDLRPSPWHDELEEPVDTVLGAVTDREALEAALVGCDAVAHLAAVADVNDVHAEPETAELTNSRGTVAVLEACRRAGVKRVVYASTIWVYSDCEPEAVDEDTLIAPPSHLYTSTKLAGELYCKSYQELYGIDYTILRFGIPYGPRAREAAVIPAFVNKAFAGEPLTLAGDGMQSRRFVYVEDLADGVALGLEDVATNRIYNLASDENVTIRQIAETVQEVVGDVEIVFTPARPGDFGGKIVSSERARRELGWSAATPFATGVRKYIDWRRVQARGGGGGAARRTGGIGAAEPVGAGEADLAGSDLGPGALVASAATTEPVALNGRGAGSEPGEGRKVLVISADIGEGHDLPARAVARELREEDPTAQVSVVNGLPAMGPALTKVLRENSAFMFRWVPWLFNLQYLLFMYLRPTRWLATRLLTLFGRRGLTRLILAHDPDVIVSTYPGVTAILGEMRRRGRLDIPCYSSITDLAGLRFWAHPGIDLHLITHPESAEEVELIAGPGSVRWAKPPTSPAFLEPRDRAQARAALGLPDPDPAHPVIAVSGGGWGVGDLVGATAAALDVPDATVLCLCGRNDGLRKRIAARFAGDPRLRVLGFTDQMGDILAASDALIHSSAGLTVLEAIIRGCPVISYGFGYGHVRASNRALERFGLAQVVSRPDGLRAALDRALEHRPEPDGRFARRTSTASYILSNQRRSEPLSAWRLRLVGATGGLAALLVLAGWSFTSSMSYSLVSHFTYTRPVTAVVTAQPQVGVMIDAGGSQLPALERAAARSGMRVSFALNRATAALADHVLDAGDEALPRLPDGGLISWLHTRGELRALERRLGWGRHFLYASSGPSLGQWLFAHGAGGRLVAGALRITPSADPAVHLHAGEVIELRVQRVSTALRQLHRLCSELRNERLKAVPVGELLQDSGTPV